MAEVTTTAVEEKAVSTIGTILETSEDGTTYEKLCRIKSYPDLGGEPNTLKTTDMEDDTETSMLGVQKMDSMSFKANYTLKSYIAVNTKARKNLYYRLKMGENGKDGIATWQGQHSVYVNSGEVDSVREMTIAVSPSTKIELSAATA